MWVQVNISLDDGRPLGLMIRGGAEYALGIYITGVDRGSAAEYGGLKVLMQGVTSCSWGPLLGRLCALGPPSHRGHIIASP